MDGGSGMVGDDAQIFTIEGIAAAFLILFTTYLAVSTTTVLTPGDTHIADLQLTQLGNDALAIMDTPDATGQLSELQNYIYQGKPDDFHIHMKYYLNKLPGTIDNDRVKFSARYYYRNNLGNSEVFPFDNSDEYYHENSVTVTKWVWIPGTPVLNPPPNMRDPDPPPPNLSIPKVVLLEVHLWR